MVQLFLTLAGVTLLFAVAQVNGALEAAAQRVLRLARGRGAVLPVVFFVLAALVAMVGPGAILATAIVAPFAMTAGVRAGVSPFLIALMVGNGANAGNLSPFSTVGVIVGGLMTRAGLGGHEYRVWFFHAAAHILVAAAAYGLFGAWRARGTGAVKIQSGEILPLDRKQQVTLAVLGLWMVAVTAFRAPLHYAGFAAAAVLLALRMAEPWAAVKRMPWKVIALVVTISTAVGYLERAGGLAWFQDLLARLATPETVHGVIALLTGAISAYSSTSGVVLPAFLPMTPGIAARLPGVDPVALAVSINIGSALVDVSPLSTIGALAIAAAPPETDTKRLFRNLLWWGLSMSVVGAVICYLGAPWFAPR